MDWFGKARFPVPVSAMDWFGKARFPVPVSTMDWSGRRSFQRRKSSASPNPARAGFRRQIHANREFVRQTRGFPYRLVSAMDWFGKAGFPVPNEADETRKKRKP